MPTSENAPTPQGPADEPESAGKLELHRDTLQDLDVPAHDAVKGGMPVITLNCYSVQVCLTDGCTIRR
jgi:hypothetical protein